MLFIRSGWKEAYDNKSDEDRTKAALRHGSGKDGRISFQDVDQASRPPAGGYGGKTVRGLLE